MLSGAIAQSTELPTGTATKLQVTPSSRLVSLTDTACLGAEKFRALAMRLENLNSQRNIKALQVTSSVVNEGKTLVSANLAVTLARRGRSKVLLIEGDLHRPTLSSLLSSTPTLGLVQWWNDKRKDLTPYLYELDAVPLWFLSAGGQADKPSEILESQRFTEEFKKLTSWFDWILVDSTPMLPTVDANVWSRLVDGTLLVVREGIASVKALKEGLASLDNPKLVGIVLNEASDFDRMNYEQHYLKVLRPRRKVAE
jgi:protein-tyrosine kinase